MLDNALRQAIVEALERTPGLNKNQLARAVDTSFRVARYHIQALVEAGLVLELDSEQGNEALFFLPEDKHLWKPERTRVLFGREGVRRVAVYIAEHPGATTKQIAEAFELSPQAVRWHLRNLRDRTLIVQARLGKDHVEYHPTTPLIEWSQRVGPRYEDAGPWTETPTPAPPITEDPEPEA